MVIGEETDSAMVTERLRLWWADFARLR